MFKFLFSMILIFGIIFFSIKTNNDVEIVTGKHSEYVAAYYQTNCFLSGKVTVCGKYYHESETKYYIDTKKFKNINVFKKSFYDSIEEGNKIEISYKYVFYNVIIGYKKV